MQIKWNKKSIIVSIIKYKPEGDFCRNPPLWECMLVKECMIEIDEMLKIDEIIEIECMLVNEWM